MVVTRVAVSDDEAEEISTHQTTIFTELLGDLVLEQYVEDGVRGIHCIGTSTLSGKVIGLYFS